MKLISGNSNKPLASQIAYHLNKPLEATVISKFNDGEIKVEIQDSIRGEDVFLIQSTSFPTNDNLMELLITIDALKRGSAGRVTAVIPYFGYARQDRKSAPRTPISAKLVANLITVAGADRVLCLDLHAAQIQGFFDIPVDNIFANVLFVNDIKENYLTDSKPITIVSPDMGGVVRARSMAKWLGCEMAIIDKRRQAAGVSEVMNIIGDVKGKNCILIDDIVDSAGTLCNAAKSIVEAGATSVSAYVTHGVFSGQAFEKIEASPISSFICTDSIFHEDIAKNKCSKIRYISIDKLLASAIEKIHSEESLSNMFLK